MKRSHMPAVIMIALASLMMVWLVSDTNWVRSQPPDVARKQIQEMRRQYALGLQLLGRIDDQLASKEYKSAAKSLEELAAVKAKLGKANLPAVVKRSVATWDQRIRNHAKRLKEEGIKLPNAVAALDKPLTPNRPKTRNDPIPGKRPLKSYELDVYGPLPFPETVHGFIDDEIALLLERQNKNGSFAYIGKRKTEAGGTVENVTLASLAGHALREHVERNPAKIEQAIRRALDFVVYMVRSGKLRTDVWDAGWRHAYALRFLVHEYPHVNGPKRRRLVEDACAFLINELKYLQQRTRKQRSEDFRWKMHSSAGMVVEDHEETGQAVVAKCPKDAAAYQGGIRQGDILLTANGNRVGTTHRYYTRQRFWVGGDTIKFTVLRDGQARTINVYLRPRFPGSLGFDCVEDGKGQVFVAKIEALSNPLGKTINKGDQVLKIDDKAVSRMKNIDALKLFAGQKVKIEITRKEQKHTFNLICVPIQGGSLGIEINRSVDQTTQDGLAIKSFNDGSCLQKAGLKQGDRILRINETLILNRRHFEEVERTLWHGLKVNVTYLPESGGASKTVEATTGPQPHQKWLAGYHGLAMVKGGVAIKSVAADSPAGKAGCRKGDRILEINGKQVNRHVDAQLLLSLVFAHHKCAMKVSRNNQIKVLEWVARPPARSPWLSGRESQSGGWVYYPHIRGGTTFLTADIMRFLIKAKATMPLDIPDDMLYQPFVLLSRLRKKQPNSNVESYRYDAGGSFWRYQDIRADVGRINSLEHTLLMYCDAGFKHDGMLRTQKHLALTLQEWLKHRAILDLVKGDHGQYSIAAWFWPYSYLTTLEAAEYFTHDDDLKDRVQKMALQAYFKYMKPEFMQQLGRVSWRIGYTKRDKQLLRTCLVLDGLATMKPLYRTIKVDHPALKEAMVKFKAARYGEAHILLQSIKPKPADNELADQVKRMQTAVRDRFVTRLETIKQIHLEYPHDGRRHLDAVKVNFTGYPGMSEVKALASAWNAESEGRKSLPEPPTEP